MLPYACACNRNTLTIDLIGGGGEGFIRAVISRTLIFLQHRWLSKNRLGMGIRDIGNDTVHTEYAASCSR